MNDKIRVEAIYKPGPNNTKKFERFDVTVGTVTREVPIKFMRISEVPALQALLAEAYQEGYAKGLEIENRP